MKMHLSVVIPVYGGSELIPELKQRLEKSLEALTPDFEIILVFDCSPDNGWQMISKECRTDRRIKGICLSRNFGQHYAITAGLAHAQGEWIVVMDCDLQDRPEEIPKLYWKSQEGYDIVFAQRKFRKDRFLKRLSSRMFYKLFSYMTDSEQDASVANFGIYRKSVIEAVLSMGDKVRYFPTMVQWVGFHKVGIPVEHGERESGESGYSWGSLFQLAFGNMIAFSDKALHLTVKFGMLLCALAFATAAYYFLRYILGGITVSGYTSIILSIWFLAGVIIFVLGIIGIYLGRVFEQTKMRPSYIIKESKNLDED